MLSIFIDYSQCGVRGKIRRSRMVGGLPSARGMWPWQVGLYRQMQRSGEYFSYVYATCQLSFRSLRSNQHIIFLRGTSHHFHHRHPHPHHHAHHHHHHHHIVSYYHHHYPYYLNQYHCHHSIPHITGISIIKIIIFVNAANVVGAIIVPYGTSPTLK